MPNPNPRIGYDEHIYFTTNLHRWPLLGVSVWSKPEVGQVVRLVEDEVDPVKNFQQKAVSTNHHFRVMAFDWDAQTIELSEIEVAPLWVPYASPHDRRNAIEVAIDKAVNSVRGSEALGRRLVDAFKHYVDGWTKSVPARRNEAKAMADKALAEALGEGAAK